MKILILKDEIISKTTLNPVLSEVAGIYQANTGITPEFVVEEHDYSVYPIEDYYDGNFGIKRTYLAEHAERVYKRYAEEIDFLVFMVHQSNWKLKNIWGWNMSHAYAGYEIEQVRYDATNGANTVGTLYHELMHAKDSFIYRYTQKAIRFIVGVKNWDDNVVHGEGEPWQYIRYKENQAALLAIREPFGEALKERRSIYDMKVSLLQQIINLARQVIELQRRAIIEKNKKTLPCYPTQIKKSC